jgi:hypothetical protein
LKENSWNAPVRLLVSNVECTSDQEDNPDEPGFFIMHKCACNKHVTDFFRLIDNCRQHATPLFCHQQKYVRQEAPHIPHPQGQESQISERLPRVCPLDWFDPDYFNNMDVSFRALYVDAPISLPLFEDCDVNPNPDWKTMPKKEFMMK